MATWGAKPGPQPPACPIDDCDNPPFRNQIGDYCEMHRKLFDSQNGNAPTSVPHRDDPELLEREAAKAAEQEAIEYAQRRRVKEWEILENGIRRPLSFYTDEELAELDSGADADVETMKARLSPRAVAPRASSYRDRLAELESELATNEVIAGEVQGNAQWWEGQARGYQELLEVAYSRIRAAKDAKSRAEVRTILTALESLLHEELHGDW